jgi:glycosyltransferase involved in cell wall biosynthesis
MRISVVVIVYNLEAYIGQAIDSVLNQSRKADEIIVVDDCSTDASAERVRAYGDKVRCLRMERNSGALLTALHGVKAASGDIICMLDGDDYWACNKLEVVEREFSADPDLMLLSHDHVRVADNGAELSIRDETHRNIAYIRRRSKSAAQFLDLLKQTILEQRGYWLGSAYSFRRHLFDAAKFEKQIRPFDFDQLRQTYLDLTIAPFLVITNPRKNVGYTSETRFIYRIHDTASMATGVTPESAIKLALKGRNMNELIALILRENHASPAYMRRQLIVQQYDYLSALYSRDLGTAARLYARLARKYWSWRQLKTETIRFAGVLILGPRKFLVLKKAQRNARAPG